MSKRRLVQAVAATALAGLPMLSGGVALADGSHGGHSSGPTDESVCNANSEGSASNSPGVQSGNLVQAPIGNCSETGDITVNVAPIQPPGGTTPTS